MNTAFGGFGAERQSAMPNNAQFSDIHPKTHARKCPGHNQHDRLRLWRIASANPP